MTPPSAAAPDDPLSGVHGPVLFFDADCGLCSRLILLLLRLDRAGRLRFAPLRGPTAQAYLRRERLPTNDFDTLIFVPDASRGGGESYAVRTAGVIGALRAIGGGARIVAAILAVVPAGLRDFGYRVVARLRYALFGRAKPGLLRRADWRGRILDEENGRR